MFGFMRPQSPSVDASPFKGLGRATYSAIASAAASSSFMKWQTAVAIGTPLVFGFGCWYFLSGNDDEGSRTDLYKFKSRTMIPENAPDNTPEFDIYDDDDDEDEEEDEDEKEEEEQNEAEGQEADERSVETANVMEAELLDLEVEEDADIEPFWERAQVFMFRGNKLYKAGRYREAVRAYSTAIRYCPPERKSELCKLYLNKAVIYEKMEVYEAVKKDCCKVLEINPTCAKALLLRARAAQLNNELEDALEDITALCIMERFENADSLMAADKILKELGRAHAKEAMSKRQLAMPSRHFIKTYFSSFMEDPTKNIFTKEESENIEEEDQETEPTRKVRSRRSRTGTRRVLTSDDFTRTFIIRPNDWCAIKEKEAKQGGYLYAQKALKAHNYDLLMVALEGELEKKESRYKMETHLLRGTFYLLSGDQHKALEDFNIVADSKDVYVKVRVNALIKRATTFIQLEDPERCMADFNTAVDLDPRNPDIYHHRGQAHLILEKVPEAMSDFNKAISLSPRFALAFVQKCYTDYRYAFSVRDIEKMKDAIESFHGAIKKFPKCSDCYSLLGIVLCDQQRYKEAEGFLRKAAEIDPENSSVYVHRGLLTLQWTGNVEKAKRMISKALSIDERCEFAYETLGVIEVQRGNFKCAVEHFDKAIPLAKTELEMSYLFSLRFTAQVQLKIIEHSETPLDKVAKVLRPSDADEITEKQCSTQTQLVPLKKHIDIHHDPFKQILSG